MILKRPTNMPTHYNHDTCHPLIFFIDIFHYLLHFIDLQLTPPLASTHLQSLLIFNLHPYLLLLIFSHCWSSIDTLNRCLLVLNWHRQSIQIYHQHKGSDWYSDSVVVDRLDSDWNASNLVLIHSRFLWNSTVYFGRTVACVIWRMQ